MVCAPRLGSGLGRGTPNQCRLRHPHRRPFSIGHRFIADELHAAGHGASERRVWRLYSQDQLFSHTIKRARKHGKTPGPRVCDDLVKRDFTASSINELWLTDITEHHTGEGKLYMCAVKDVYSNKIVGYAIDSRMKSRLAVAAIEDAVARRGGPRAAAGCVVHSDRGSQGGFNWSSQHLEYGGRQEWRRRTGLPRPAMCPRACDGSGARIEHCGPRRGPRDVPSPHGRCSVSSGG